MEIKQRILRLFMLLGILIGSHMTSFAYENIIYSSSWGMFVGEEKTINIRHILRHSVDIPYYREYCEDYFIREVRIGGNERIEVVEQTDSTVTIRAIKEDPNLPAYLDIAINTDYYHANIVLSWEIDVRYDNFQSISWRSLENGRWCGTQTPLTVIKGSTIYVIPLRSSLRSVEGCMITYTLNGRYPDAQYSDEIYHTFCSNVGAPIKIDESCTLNMIAEEGYSPSGLVEMSETVYGWTKPAVCYNVVAVDGGTAEKPFTASEANAIFGSLMNDSITSTDWYVKGKVVSIKEQFGTQYGNATFYISEDGTENNQFYIYRAYYLGNTRYAGQETVLNVGDDVVVCGKITNYRGYKLETLPLKAYVVSINGETSNIADIQANANKGNAIYDLFGRHQANPHKGVYLREGKKILLK